jgi:hypothetical protein
MTKMKKLIALTVIFVLVLAACGDGNTPNNENNNNNGNTTGTTLTIADMNSAGDCEVEYGGVNFDLVHNTEVTKTVSSGTRYAYITYHYFTEDEYYSGRDLVTHNRTCSCPVFRTDSITCEEEKNTRFGLTRNTVVTLISGFGYDRFANVTETFENITNSVNEYYTKYIKLKTRGFNAIQTWFWDAVESFNDAPAGTTHTITLTESFEFPSVSRAYAGSVHYGHLFKEGQNKKIIIQGDSVERTITNSGKTLQYDYYQLDSGSPFLVIPNGITLELGNNITLDGNSIPYSVVIVEGGGTLIMNSGSTVKRANDCGVAVEGTFIMNDGTISGNKYGAHDDWGTTTGGGVSVRSGTFTMSGGIIRDNNAIMVNGGGGGVSVLGGTFTMNGGTISNNTVSPSTMINFTRGGGVYVGINGSFIKTGGTIDDTNEADFGKVAYDISTYENKYRETTAGPTDDMDSSKTGVAGGWEE